MERCGTCKHWGDDDEKETNDAVRTCQKIRGPNNCEYDLRKDPGGIVMAVDGSNYHAAVFSEAEFGCVLHEPKELNDAGQ